MGFGDKTLGINMGRMLGKTEDFQTAFYGGVNVLGFASAGVSTPGCVGMQVLFHGKTSKEQYFYYFTTFDCKKQEEVRRPPLKL